MKYPNDREYDPYEEETNKEKYNLIRQVIFSCSSLLYAARVRICDFFQLWTSILEIFLVWSETELQEKHEAIKPEIKDQRNKIEFYIAEIKYPFLGSMLPVLDTEVDLKTSIFFIGDFLANPYLIAHFEEKECRIVFSF